MSHFSNIGFKVENQGDLTKLLENIGPKSVPARVSKGHYWRFLDSSGAEMYIQTDEQNEAIGANPHFESSALWRIQITQRIPGTHSPLDGTYLGWMSKKLNPDYLEHPIAFDSPDFLMFEDNPVPFNAKVQLAAFAENIKTYESADEAKRLGEELKLAEKAFIPSGTFSLTGEDSKPIRGEAILSGFIRKAEVRINQFSGLEFQWMEVDTLNGVLDVVCDIGAIDPKIGHIVNGSFWLSGRIIEII